MSDIDEEAVDIPEPETAIHETTRDVSAFDPGADAPTLPDHEPKFGEDPRYDPSGMGRQPDVEEEDEDHR